VKKKFIPMAIIVAVAAALAAGTLVRKVAANDDHHDRFEFQSDTLVLSRSVYVGTASTVAIGETLPLGCAGGPNGSTTVNVPTTSTGTATPVTVTCGIATDNGEAPNLFDSHNVWNNSGSDGSVGVLPTGYAAELAKVPITILPGLPTTVGSTSTAFPFGLWFADANTLYVCGEGAGTLVTPLVNGNVAGAQGLATAGLQKWSLVNGTWTVLYVLQDGPDIGVPYTVRNYPAAIDPATGDCRNITGRHNHDGTVTIDAITSAISANGDTGADPNKQVKVTDVPSATTLPTGNRPWGNSLAIATPCVRQRRAKCSVEWLSHPKTATAATMTTASAAIILGSAVPIR